MTKRLAFLFPGQGAQYPGMGKDFYDQFLEAKEVFQEADDFLKACFSRLIFEGPQEELTLTKKAQIAIYITSIAILKVVRQQFAELYPSVCAGLSLGEYTALYAAGKISFLEGLSLVQCRAEAMQKACEERKGTMQVVLGLSEEVVQTIIDQLNPPHLVWVANLNCPGQIVIAGENQALVVAAEHLKQAGAKRVLRLDVSGAFHSGLMQSAQEALTQKIEQITWLESEIDVVMNVPGDFIRTKEDMKRALVEQVISPVRWEKGIRKMDASQIEMYIEMGPGKTLAGMNKRIGIQAPTWSIEKLSDLETIALLIQR